MTFLNQLFTACVPNALKDHAYGVSDRLLTSLEDKQQDKLASLLKASPELVEQLARALLGSQYVLDSCCRDPDLLLGWLLVDTPYTALSAARVFTFVEQACSDCQSTELLDQILRQQRRRLMVAIVWRDLNRLSEFAEVCESMTALAEACLQQALNFHYGDLLTKHGVPIGKNSGEPQPMLVLGMGKLGGAELNVSSDIDLIFAFPEAGETNHEPRPLDNQQFFTRLAQRLIKSLNETTVDGFVFRVDMRLRPYGQSGALVSSFAALENYYETQGREWERFAAIKARVVACSTVVGVEEPLLLQQQASEQLVDILRPFIYRKYIDFSVIESLRKLKSMIVQEVQRKGMQGNIKLGAGGIRELEFIVQSFQLIRGGREPQFQARHWLRVLERLCNERIIAADVGQALRQSYCFLRNVEHVLQAYQDKQTQQLPVEAQQQFIVAWLMGFDDWQSFIDRLDGYRRCVSEEFEQVIAAPKDKNISLVQSDEWSSLWQSGLEEPEKFLSSQGCVQTEEVLEQLQNLAESWHVKNLSDSARESLDQLVPQLLAVVTELEHPDETLLRMFAWLEKVAGRSSYITLLLENPEVLRYLAILFQGSVWVAEWLAQMPSLLNELLDIEGLYTLPSKEQLRDELRQQMLRIDPEDLESHMEVLRYFKLAHSLRVAASDLAGALPLMNISDYLTWIAEVVLEQVLQLAWQQLVSRHGLPRQLEGSDSESDTPGFLVVAYGKLGGIELNYSSDLDLVFIYQADQQGTTDGKSVIDNQTFYTRLGQKIIHILNTRTLSGPLYEVDMRLRPSGNSGLLVSSLSAFTRYQQQDAWLWEHQALVRARPILGDSYLMEGFKQLRCQVLESKRELPGLRQSVIDMRQKMRDHLGSSTKNHKNTSQTPLFHLKQDAGGIVDIEFMVQYAVLAWANQYPALSEYTDNIRILEGLRGSQLVPAEQADGLIDIYKAYREVSHRLALQKQSSLITEEQFAEYQLGRQQQQIQTLWRQWLNV